MTLRELLKKDFGIDFPISGGFGNGPDEAVVIHRAVPNDYTSVEYGILRCLGIGRHIEWRTLQQSLMGHGERKLDQIKIETITRAGAERITQVENYYFDITECL